jgi:mannose-6-phosphate isomerase-like protein (cupin superfamily)
MRAETLSTTRQHLLPIALREKMVMKKALIFVLSLFILWMAAPLVTSEPQPKAVSGYVVERDRDVAKNEPGPHDGGGPSTGYIFFEKVPDLKFSFRKRVLHKGAAIGYHLQKTDEVYYIIDGRGTMTINDHPFTVKRGDAILTRGGSSHGLVQKGTMDLTIIISYQKE